MSEIKNEEFGMNELEIYDEVTDAEFIEEDEGGIDLPVIALAGAGLFAAGAAAAKLVPKGVNWVKTKIAKSDEKEEVEAPKKKFKDRFKKNDKYVEIKDTETDEEE